MERNNVRESKNIAMMEDKSTRLEMRGQRRTLRDTNNRSQAEISTHSPRSSSKTSLSTNDELKRSANSTRSPANRASRNVDVVQASYKVCDDDTLAEIDAFDDERLAQAFSPNLERRTAVSLAQPNDIVELSPQRSEKSDLKILHISFYLVHDSRLW